MTIQIGSISTCTPEHSVRLADKEMVGDYWLGDDERLREKYVRICSHSGVEHRSFIQSHDQIIAKRGLAERAALFEEYGPPLLCSVLSDTIEKNDIDPDTIDTLIFTSCSVPVIPSIDALALSMLGLSASVNRIPMFQHGCAGGVVGLALASRLAAMGKTILLSSIELCSLVFQEENRDGTQLVGGAIFSDGAAATVVSPDCDGPKLVHAQSFLLEGTRGLMGYDLQDNGFHLRLDRELPRVLLDRIPGCLEKFLQGAGVSRESIGAWLFHPGGIKILNFLRETLSLELQDCHWAYDVLKDHGNMSSATIYFVLDAFLRSRSLKSGEYGVVVGIGPGLTLELILIQG